MSTRLLHSATLAVAVLAANAFAADATVSATTTTAATTGNDAARIAALEKAVSDLMQEKGESLLTAQRASEIRSVVQDVLSDADTRANLAGTSATAGYDDGFFIASPDGNFKMKINGELRPLRTALANGDVVEVIRGPKPVVPVDWRSLTVTGRARSAIRRHIRLTHCHTCRRQSLDHPAWTEYWLTYLVAQHLC
jgi:molybdopterin converting factor small subunit